MSRTLLIGVAGHRHLQHASRTHLRACLHQVLAQLESTFPDDHLCLASSLAEGADRLAARVALERGLALIAPLPMQARCFERDFPDSVREFRELMQASRHVFVVAEADSARARYLPAARWIARCSHFLLALWDGDQDAIVPGSTGYSVGLRLEGRACGDYQAACLGPVFHIPTPRRAGTWLAESAWRFPSGRPQDLVAYRADRGCAPGPATGDASPI